MTEDDIAWMLEQMNGGDENEEGIDVADDHVEASKMGQEEKCDLFKEMLREKNVNPFGSYDTEELKFIDDDRYKLIESDQERRGLFDLVCKELIKEKKDKSTMREVKAKGAKIDTEMDIYEQLMRSESGDPPMSWPKFCQKFRTDARFLSVKSSLKRQSRYEGYLRKLNKVKKRQQKEKELSKEVKGGEDEDDGETKDSEEKEYESFIEMLKDLNEDYKLTKMRETFDTCWDLVCRKCGYDIRFLSVKSEAKRKNTELLALERLKNKRRLDQQRAMGDASSERKKLMRSTAEKTLTSLLNDYVFHAEATDTEIIDFLTKKRGYPQDVYPLADSYECTLDKSDVVRLVQRHKDNIWNKRGARLSAFLRENSHKFHLKDDWQPNVSDLIFDSTQQGPSYGKSIISSILGNTLPEPVLTRLYELYNNKPQASTTDPDIDKFASEILYWFEKSFIQYKKAEVEHLLKELSTAVVSNNFVQHIVSQEVLSNPTIQTEPQNHTQVIDSLYTRIVDTLKSDSRYMALDFIEAERSSTLKSLIVSSIKSNKNSLF
ncbi:Pre-mRNA-splicing factor dre4 [Zancudomyces culisetae]|uniref:Pre-mRNA-splicing factor dre4 n=1 Tax=Zancudomyces culisetae TaxID=1213189 RepID=A0A1R1PGY4_ZANCU|nr:Pre-mRNA-splicing factor dre4 [Zancudomyces culisetae]|eukprot:OMH80173.1 Pre-mRNA-splicing factor dre4 [Zancudomyces culisetae]